MRTFHDALFVRWQKQLPRLRQVQALLAATPPAPIQGRSFGSDRVRDIRSGASRAKKEGSRKGASAGTQSSARRIGSSLAARWRVFLCSMGHDWTFCTDIIKSGAVENTYTWDKHCKRKGCGAHQNICMHVIGGQRLLFCDKEWVDSKCKP